MAERAEMSKEKRALLKELRKLSDDEVRQRMTEQWSKQFKDDPARLQRALNRLEEDPEKNLIKQIKKELDTQRKETRTEKERAITTEFDRHADVLQEFWGSSTPNRLIPADQVPEY